MWDFGQLTHHTEELYTRQIVRRFVVPLTPVVSIAGQRVVCIMLQITAYVICDLVRAKNLEALNFSAFFLDNLATNRYIYEYRILYCNRTHKLLPRKLRKLCPRFQNQIKI